MQLQQLAEIIASKIRKSVRFARPHRAASPVRESRVVKSGVRPDPLDRPDRQTLGQVVSQAELISRRGRWKRAGMVVVCASGCFDLLHPGHIRLVEHARSLPDILVVAIESDRSVRARSEAGTAPGRSAGLRPITPAVERAEILAALAAVDSVVEWEGASPDPFLARLLPDVVILGGSAVSGSVTPRHAGELEGLGCMIARVPLEPGYSTALLIERILELRV
jgi:rfaE bifunctional protein nucleotidyltransferase chain/domain